MPRAAPRLECNVEVRFGFLALRRASALSAGLALLAPATFPGSRADFTCPDSWFVLGHLADLSSE